MAGETQSDTQDVQQLRDPPNATFRGWPILLVGAAASESAFISKLKIPFNHYYFTATEGERMPPQPAKIAKLANWEDEEPSLEDKTAFKRALAIYIQKTDQRNNLPQASMETYKQVLPYLQDIVPKWSRVRTNGLNGEKHKAHQFYMDTIRNTLKSSRQLRRLILEYEKSLLEEEDDEDSDVQLPETKAAAADPKEAAAIELVMETPNPDDELANTNKPKDASEDGTMPEVKLVGSKRSFSQVSEPKDISSAEKIVAELDHLNNLHDEMMDKYDRFVGAYEAWESSASEFRCFKAPKIRFFD